MMRSPEPLLARRVGVDRATAHTLFRTVTARNPAVRLAPITTGITTGASLFLTIGLPLVALAATSGGSPAIVIALFLLVIAAAFLGETTTAHGQARLAAAIIEHARARQQCLHCDYDLAPTLAAGNRTCPECGEPALHLAHDRQG